jgi:hypothetical protein
VSDIALKPFAGEPGEERVEVRVLSAGEDGLARAVVATSCEAVAGGAVRLDFAVDGMRKGLWLSSLDAADPAAWALAAAAWPVVEHDAGLGETLIRPIAAARARGSGARRLQAIQWGATRPEATEVLLLSQGSRASLERSLCAFALCETAHPFNLRVALMEARAWGEIAALCAAFAERFPLPIRLESFAGAESAVALDGGASGFRAVLRAGVVPRHRSSSTFVNSFASVRSVASFLNSRASVFRSPRTSSGNFSIGP